MKSWLSLLVLVLLTGCGRALWNNPYPASQRDDNIIYSAFSERPKHLDPVQSYAENEAVFTQQIYEPPLQYHYLQRPYTLVPLTATDVPKPQRFDQDGNALPETADSEEVAFSVYEIKIMPGIMYQPHPAFAKDAAGNLLYHSLGAKQLEDIYVLNDFKGSGTRELVAEDYVYQIKRLAHPRLHSPIFGLMSEYLVGLKELSAELKKADAALKAGEFLDLRKFPLEGVEVVDSHTYRVKLRGVYPQFVYWLAMPFFAPVPWEADRFHSQPGMERKNLTLDWYPIGTGPYMMRINDPNRQMVLEKNPNFRGEKYPAEGEPEDAAAGLLKDAGKLLPFVDKAIFTLEKEAIPYWNKFLQGYYDSSGITSDSFDQAVQVGSSGEIELSESMREKGIQLFTSVEPSTFYVGFNMLDQVVGGKSERARKLRHAVSIAMDFEEFISIFRNGRGIAGQGPIPPGIFGHIDGCEGINPYVYDCANGQPQRKPIEYAQKQLAEAGYPNGIEAESGKPLVLYFDTTASGPEDKARLDWLRRQFDRLSIQLVIRTTDFNRFQDKVRRGEVQIFFFGWNADYPDPENFLFLLHGPQSRALKNGENSANYENPEFDRLFEQMKDMENGPERQAVIDKMVEIARFDAPWSWGFHPKEYVLAHSWNSNIKPNEMARNGLKYRRVDPQQRVEKRIAWNQPVVLPIAVGALVLAISIAPAIITYRRRERARGRAPR
jgi:ABC-type transport system substrate-binding protein